MFSIVTIGIILVGYWASLQRPNVPQSTEFDVYDPDCQEPLPDSGAAPAPPSTGTAWMEQ